MARSLRRRPRGADYWPGFVDVLSTMLIIVLFLLLVFTLAQLFLNQVLSGRNEALVRLNQQVAELADLLQMEKASNADLRRNLGQLSAELAASTAARDTLSSQLSDAQRQLSVSADALAEAKDQAAASRGALAELQSRLGASRQALTEEQRLSADARRQVELLNQQIAALRTQLAQISKALELSEKNEAAQKVQIADLGKRLNRALAGKVEELAKYRSEFFGRLREVLGNRPDIHIVGDRFVFQSEVLFPTASADLVPEGQAQIDRLAATLKEIAKEIPANIPWVLRVDGFTDKRPIHTAQFPSNWELSTARAISVVRQLIADGIPPERLAANGFAEYHPLVRGDSEEAYSKNRRIELKLTER
jgi:chemotaxis protein MotB